MDTLFQAIEIKDAVAATPAIANDSPAFTHMRVAPDTPNPTTMAFATPQAMYLHILADVCNHRPDLIECLNQITFTLGQINRMPHSDEAPFHNGYTIAAEDFDHWASTIPRYVYEGFASDLMDMGNALVWLGEMFQPVGTDRKQKETNATDAMDEKRTKSPRSPRPDSSPSQMDLVHTTDSDTSYEEPRRRRLPKARKTAPKLPKLPRLPKSRLPKVPKAKLPRAASRVVSKEAFSTTSLKCCHCQTSHSPEWRKGPDGQRNLCNACGLFFSKLRAKLGEELGGQFMCYRRRIGDMDRRLPLKEEARDALTS